MPPGEMSDQVTPSVLPFGARLVAAVRRRGPLCVGIDPHPALLAAWGLPDDVHGLERFTGTVVEALGPLVAVLKPQAAFYERHGSRGVAVLESAIAGAREAGALTIVDAKRGDIGSTMAAYADAFAAEGSPLAGDAVTVSPYLGFGSLRPILDVAAANGRGLFVLAFTSNPEGSQVQGARGEGRATSVGQEMIDAAAAENAGAAPLGSVGVVVGATVGRADGAQGPAGAPDLSTLNGPILAPGLGAQGATADDLRAVFGDALHHVLPSSSRDVLRAGPSVDALQEAAGRTVEAIRAVLGPLAEDPRAATR